MTNIEKSPEQLNAEAAAPYHCWICNPTGTTKDDRHGRDDLPKRLACHRWARRVDDHVTRLVSRQPPTVFNFDTSGWETLEGAVSGMAMSGSMLRRLETPGAQYPWASGFMALRKTCREHHYDHRRADRPYWRGRLCWEAVRLTVIGGEKALAMKGTLSPDEARRVLRLETIDDLLLDAFDRIESTMRYVEERAERRAREDEGHGPGPIPQPAHIHHPLDGLHREECPQCQRAA